MNATIPEKDSAFICHLQILEITVALVLFIIVYNYERIDKKCFPPGPRGLPLLGNLYQLGKNPHETLMNFSRQYGDVFSLKLGNKKAIVVHGYETILQALVKQSEDFAGRPDFKNYKEYAAGSSISFHPYNDILKLHRRTAGQALRKLLQDEDRSFEKIVEREIWNLLEDWSNGDGSSCIIEDPVTDTVRAISSVLYSVCYGEEASLSVDSEYKDLMTSFNPGTELFSAGNQYDLLPWPLKMMTNKKKILEHSKRMRKFVDLNMKQRIKYENEFHNELSKDVLALMSDASSRLSDQLKCKNMPTDYLMNTPIEMMSAGSETSSAAIIWLILYMIAFPDVQKHIQTEIDEVIGDSRFPTFSDCKSLPFTEAAILEVTRLTMVVPLGLPHCAVKDTILNNYFIPKDTLVFVNLYSIGRDPRIWESPDIFNPNRFLLKTPHNQYAVNQSKAKLVLQFGAGRRKCIGELLGKTQVFLFFVTLLQQRTFSAVPGCRINLEPIFGDVLKPVPFQCISKPR